MSAFGGKADIIQGKADIKICPLMTQSGHLTTLHLVNRIAGRALPYMFRTRRIVQAATRGKYILQPLRCKRE